MPAAVLTSQVGVAFTSGRGLHEQSILDGWTTVPGESRQFRVDTQAPLGQASGQPALTFTLHDQECASILENTKLTQSSSLSVRT